MKNFDPLRDNTWAGYVGDMLRGQQPINQLIPHHPYIDALPQIEQLLEKNTQYFMLLTLAEARGVLSDLMGQTDDFFSYTLGGGNIKDIWDGAHNFAGFSTYLDEANQLQFNLKGLGITAKACRYGGVAYIKINGYPSLRRILKGTRYRAGNMQLLELGIGWRGMTYSIYQGAKFCVYFSLAFRAMELIFKNDYTLIDFFGDVIADAAKTIISCVIVGAVGFLFTLISAPVILTAGFLIITGVYLNKTLNRLDEKNGWSTTLKEKINELLVKEQKISEWNNQYMNTGLPSSFFISY